MSDNKNTPHDSLDDPLETAAEFRRQMGGITQMTEWRWRQKFADFPVAIVICGRKYYRKSEREAFVEARAAEREVA